MIELWKKTARSTLDIPSLSRVHHGDKRLAQRWLHLSSTNVGWVLFMPQHHIHELSLLALYSALRGFFLVYSGFPLSSKTKMWFDLLWFCFVFFFNTISEPTDCSAKSTKTQTAVKQYHITSQVWIDSPIKQIVTIWLDQSGCTLYFSWRLASNLAGRIALQFYQRFLVLQLDRLISFKHVICNNLYLPTGNHYYISCQSDHF